MSSYDSTTKLRSDGLRYISKVSGSQFGSLDNTTRSCFKCGVHRPTSQLKSVKLIGKFRVVCKPSCEFAKLG